jgi:hypothetical protein
MRVRAVAAPSSQSNAVGTLELECTPEGLRLMHLGVSSYRDGYAPPALTKGTSVFASWLQVEEVRVGEQHVFLGLAPSVSPLSRLCLTHFSQGTDLPEPERKRRKLIIGVATLALMLVVGLCVGSQWPNWSANASRWASVAVAALASLCVLLLGALVGVRVIAKGPDSRQLQDLFVAELRHFRPKPILLGPAPKGPEAPTVPLSDLISVVPRSTLALIIVLTASTLAAILTTTWLIQGPDQDRVARHGKNKSSREDVEARSEADEPDSEEKRDTRPSASARDVVPPSAAVATAEASAAAAAAAPVSAGTLTAGEACRCDRAASALWALDFPRLSTLLISQQSSAHKEHQHLELELAVVNNSSKALDEVNLSVQFFEDEGKSPTRLRPLHYPGALEPGAAVKWHVEARGTSFVVNNPVREVLAQDPKELASADNFAELLKANHRPVRLHGAMMLAYLGDQRAKAGALRLRDALSEPEMPYLDRVLATQGNLVTCDWAVSSTGRLRDVSACVFNVSSKPVERPGVKVRALDRLFDYRNPVAAPPLVIAEKVAPLTGSIAAGQGVRAIVGIDTDNPDGKTAAAFEVLADSAELL